MCKDISTEVLKATITAYSAFWIPTGSQKQPLIKALQFLNTPPAVAAPGATLQHRQRCICAIPAVA